VVLFNPLSRDEVRAIAVQQVEKIERLLGRSGRNLRVAPDALDQIVQDGYSLAFGARFLKRLIEDRIKLPISQHWTEGTDFVAELRDGKVMIDVAGAPGGMESLAATA
jgi:ATP-dependent Clp protease ATP-binding subunit ClpA